MEEQTAMWVMGNLGLTPCEALGGVALGVAARMVLDWLREEMGTRSRRERFRRQLRVFLSREL